MKLTQEEIKLTRIRFHLLDKETIREILEIEKIINEINDQYNIVSECLNKKLRLMTSNYFNENNMVPFNDYINDHYGSLLVLVECRITDIVLAKLKKEEDDNYQKIFIK